MAELPDVSNDCDQKPTTFDSAEKASLFTYSYQLIPANYTKPIINKPTAKPKLTPQQPQHAKQVLQQGSLRLQDKLD